MIKDEPRSYSDEEYEKNLWDAVNKVPGLEIWSNGENIIILQVWGYGEIKVCRYFQLNQEGKISHVVGFGMIGHLHEPYEEVHKNLEESNYTRLTEYPI